MSVGTIAIVVLAYAMFLVLVLSLLTSAKRGEKASRRSAARLREQARRRNRGQQRRGDEKRRDVA